MSNGELKLKIVSPQKLVYNDYVDSVTLPTTSGEITVLPNHAALISSLKHGTIVARTAKGQIPFPITGGFIEVTPDSRLTVLLS